MKEKITSIENYLLQIKNTIQTIDLYIQKIEQEIQELKSIDIGNNQSNIKQAEIIQKKPTMIRRTDEFEDSPIETDQKYKIQVVGLGTTKVDF